MASKAQRQKPAALAILVSCGILVLSDVSTIPASSRRRIWPVTRALSLIRQVGLPNHGSTQKLALLIDGDQIPPTSLRPLLDAVRARGSIVGARFYADAESVRRWSATLLENGIEPVAVPRLRGGAKDPGDIAIALDAAEICLSPRFDRISGVVIASEDPDFALLLDRIRTWGFSAFGAVAHANGFLQHAFEEASGNPVVHYAAEMRTTQKRVTLNFNDPTQGITITEEVQADLLSDEELEQLRSVLLSHGYTCESNSLLLAAAAKFFYVNQLGNLTVWPRQRTLRDVHTALELRGSNEWRCNPGDLIFVQPQASRGRTDAGSTSYTNAVQSGGPFMLRADSGLVDTILRRLGYSEHQASASCIEAFFYRNRKMLLKHGFSIGDSFEAQKQKLYEIFRAQNLLQTWYGLYGSPRRTRGMAPR